MGIARSTCYRASKGSADDTALVEAMHAIKDEFEAYGWRRFVVTTDSDHDEPVFPDLSRDCEVDGPNRLWVADLTTIAILGGFVYLAAIIAAMRGRAASQAMRSAGGSTRG